MTTLTSSNSFSIGAGGLLTEEVTVTVLPIAGPGEGKGRLENPLLAVVYDYPNAPDLWKNLAGGDVVIPPIWANARTLSGAANTLWAGSIADMEVMEEWNSPISMKLDFLQQLITIWANPPSPPSYCIWAPSYSTNLRYKVIVLGVSSGGDQITLDYVSRQGWVRGPVQLRMRIVDYAD